MCQCVSGLTSLSERHKLGFDIPHPPQLSFSSITEAEKNSTHPSSPPRDDIVLRSKQRDIIESC